MASLALKPSGCGLCTACTRTCIHGGDGGTRPDITPASNCFQFIAYFAVSTNLVNYLKDRLHQGSKAAANGVTNWMGTSAITPLVAAFLADAFLGRYWTIALFLVISVLVRTVRRRSIRRPPPPSHVHAWTQSCCKPSSLHSPVSHPCLRRRSIRSLVFFFCVRHARAYAQAYVVLTVSAAAALESAAFYAGLYLLALGGALQPVLSSFGADQFDEEERGRQSSFFNWFYLSINVGSLVGGTVLVWVQSSVSWGLGYGIPALFSALAVAAFLAGTATYRRHQPPAGSPLTRVAQVVVAACRKCGVQVPEDASTLHECVDGGGMSAIQGSRRLAHTDQFRSVATSRRFAGLIINNFLVIRSSCGIFELFADISISMFYQSNHCEIYCSYSILP
jgi:MFS family permease